MRTVWDDQNEADEFAALYQVHMGHRPTFAEDVREPVGEVHEHWWQGETNWVFAGQDARYVTIVIGPDEATVGQVVEALAGS
jgi:hypothetical protein